MKNIKVKKLTKEEFEDFILMKKIEDTSLEEITELLLNQSYLVMFWQQAYEQQKEKIERLNNDIKVLLKENENKEKVIKTQDNIINELEKWLDKKEKLTFNSWNKGIHEVQRKLQELKRSDEE